MLNHEGHKGQHEGHKVLSFRNIYFVSIVRTFRER